MLSSVLILSLLASFGDAYKVLVIFPLPVRSLSILGHGISRHLVEAGHEVTYVTLFPSKNASNKNFRQIDISASAAHMADDPISNLTNIIENKVVDSNDALFVQEFAVQAAEFSFQNENFMKLLKNKNEHFDAVIVDLLDVEIFAAIATIFDCPMIWAYSMGAHWNVLRIIDESTNPAYDPDFLTWYTHPLTFLQRIEGVWNRIKWYYYKTFIISPKETALYEKYLKPILIERERTIPSYEEIKSNVSFIFGNEHIAIRNLVSTPQNFKNIGGVHVEHPPKPLPKYLQDLMDNSKDGVIYFSMGSFWKSRALPKVLITGLLKTFGELKQTVIWKFEEDLPNVPKNVHIVHWAPQPSILAHPNCLFFISHGGLLSSIESIHFGVPVIGIPIYFDQFINVNKAVGNGYAMKVDLNYDLPANLKVAIQNMLSNTQYRAKAKELSAIYHDRPITPGTEMVHWVQHVIKTKGARHLRSPAATTPVYQKLCLDVAAVLIALLIGTIVLLRKILCFLSFCKSKNVKSKTN